MLTPKSYPKAMPDEFELSMLSERKKLLSQLENWEKEARGFCIHWEERIAKSCDLVINSISSPESIVDEIIKTYI